MITLQLLTQGNSNKYARILVIILILALTGCSDNSPEPIECDPSLFPNAVEWNRNIGGNGHLYEVVIAGEDITWEEAQQASTDRGDSWHLATITSEGENEFVKSLIIGNADFFNCCQTSSLVGRVASGPWLGATSSTNSSNDWTWNTGEPFEYTQWGQYEPFGNGNHISYAEFGDARQIVWNDIPSGNPQSPQAYIAECSVSN